MGSWDPPTQRNCLDLPSIRTPQFPQSWHFSLDCSPTTSCCTTYGYLWINTLYGYLWKIHCWITILCVTIFMEDVEGYGSTIFLRWHLMNNSRFFWFFLAAFFIDTSSAVKNVRKFYPVDNSWENGFEVNQRKLLTGEQKRSPNEEVSLLLYFHSNQVRSNFLFIYC